MAVAREWAEREATPGSGGSTGGRAAYGLLVSLDHMGYLCCGSGTVDRVRAKFVPLLLTILNVFICSERPVERWGKAPCTPSGALSMCGWPLGLLWVRELGEGDPFLIILSPAPDLPKCQWDLKVGLMCSMIKVRPANGRVEPHWPPWAARNVASDPGFPQEFLWGKKCTFLGWKVVLELSTLDSLLPAMSYYEVNVKRSTQFLI